MPTVFIVNPASGGGRTDGRWPRLEAAIREAGIEPEIAFTEKQGHGIQLAKDALGRGYDTLIAVGGDGTVNEVANGILQEGAGDSVRIGTIGMGTGKDIAKCLGIGRARTALRTIAAGQERLIDAGICDAQGIFDAEERRYFLLEASAGWVPEIAHSVPRWLKRLGDTAPYLVMTGVKMAGPMSRPMTVTIDGQSFDGDYNSVSIHNMELWAGDLTAAPGALPDDGLLDVLRWGAVSRRRILEAIRGQQNGGTHLELDGIDRHPAKLVELDSPKPTAVDLDGEDFGQLPAKITIAPRALRFLAPPA